MDKIAIFRACFSGLKHVYGTYDPSTGRCWQVKRPVTDDVLLRHLNGVQPYGVYLLDGSTTAAVVADFDEEDTGQPLGFFRLAQGRGIPVYIERSKSKGWHAWMFFSAAGVQAGKARRMVVAVLRDLGLPRIEVFPKQDTLAGTADFGNFINAPLFGLLVPRGRSVFVDPEQGFRVVADQWSLLESVRRVPEAALNAVSADPEQGLPTSAQPLPNRASHSRVHSRDRSFGLPPCARRMLAEGVSQFQRVACFRLAVHLKKAGLPQDAAVACLRIWAGRNRPAGDKAVITDPEIVRQTASAYASQYRGCGCEDPAIIPYCDPECPLSKARTQQPSQVQTG